MGKNAPRMISGLELHQSQPLGGLTDDVVAE